MKELKLLEMKNQKEEFWGFEDWKIVMKQHITLEKNILILKYFNMKILFII